jgi:leader peptidase (prepilin peptidase) / N-methyltransferase
VTAPAAFVLPMGALGIGVGSALSLALHRLPRTEPVAVGAPSWMPRSSIVVCGTAALFMAVTVRFGRSVELPAYLYLVTIGIALAVIDIDVRRLPDAVVLPSYVVSVLLLMPAGAAKADWGGAERAIAGMFALLALFFALALAYPNGLSMGDVKLAGLLGMYLGWLSWNALFLTAIGSIFIAAVGGSFAIVTKHATRHLAVPIVPCLISAALLALFLTAPISSWYGSLITA